MALNSGNFFSAATRRLDQEREHRHLDARLLVLLVGGDAERLEVGDVGVVVVGDVRDQHPVAMQVGAADLLDARQVLALDRAELGEVDLRPGQQAGERAAGRARRPPAPSRPAPGSAVLPAITALTKACTSSWVMRPFGPLPLTSSSGTPSSRASLRIVGEACGSAPCGAVGSWAGSAAVGTVRSPPGGAAAAGAVAGAGAAAGAARERRRGSGAPRRRRLRASRSRLPFDTLSPTLTLSSFTTPACDDGISIDALSLSTVIRLCSAFDLSPGLTSTSMTATSSKSPMSGTTTSTRPPSPRPSPAGAGAAGAGGAGPLSRGSAARAGVRRAGAAAAGRVALALEHQQRRAFAHLVAELDPQLLDDAGALRRNLHRRLVALDRDQRLLGLRSGRRA